MNYAKIRKMDISNGPGVRVSLFVQGCTFNCKDCFNPETHDFNSGKEFTKETMQTLLTLCDSDTIKGLSILGGEPLHIYNVLDVVEVCKKFKHKFPDKQIWLWSGFTFEIIKDNELQDKILPYIDVLVDGQFKTELKDYSLKYRGSSNQRIIDVKESLKQDKVILMEVN